MKRILSLFAVLAVSVLAYSYNYLFKDGRSDYSVVVGEDASKTERAAASEFQKYVESISGVKLPVVRRPAPAGRHVYIGYCDELARLAIMNTAQSGVFAADRAIEEYARNIWKVK